MNVESIKRRLLVKYPFFGSVVANSNFIAEPAVGTAGTDGQTIYYNPNFIESITDEEQTFIFAHEICHIAFDHIFRSEGKDKDLWNIATDSVVNAFLKQDGLPIVDDEYVYQRKNSFYNHIKGTNESTKLKIDTFPFK